MKAGNYTKVQDNEETINVELKTHSENEKITNKEDNDNVNDDILITAEAYDRLRDRTVNIKNKK